MINKTRAITYDDKKKVFWALLCLIAVSSAVYFYAISTTIVHTSARERVEREVTELTARQGETEFGYIELKNRIGLEKARELGFHEVKKPLYVSRIAGSALGLANKKPLKSFR